MPVEYVRAAAFHIVFGAIMVALFFGKDVIPRALWFFLVLLNALLVVIVLAINVRLLAKKRR